MKSEIRVQLVLLVLALLSATLLGFVAGVVLDRLTGR
jgi:hypothetical protein